MSTVVSSGAAPKKFGVGGVIAIVSVLALGGVIGVRVKNKMAQKAAIQAQMTAPDEAASSAGKEEGARATAAVLVKPVAKRWQPRISVTGTLEPIQQADIGFKAGGRLMTIKVKAGDVIKAGQVLGVVDSAEAAAQSRIAQTGVRVAEISLDMAKDGQQRADTLFQQSAVPEAQKTTATQQAMLAAAQLEQARAQARLASVAVGNATLSAPFGGLVTRAPSGIGKIVAPGEPLFHVEDTSVLKLSASVSESDAKVFEVGAAVSIENAPDAKGKVTAVLGSLDPQTRRVPVVAEIPNGKEAGLLSGSFVRAEILATEAIDVLTLPATALRPGAQDEIVVATEGKAHLVRVSFSIGPDGSLYVRKGIEAGASVVANPSPEVKEGDPIVVGEALPAAAK